MFPRCDVIINIFEDASRVAVNDAACACGAQLVSVEYRAERTRLPAALTDMTACLYCEPAFSALVEKHRAVAARGGTRGRGARTRAKHRAKQPKDKMAQLAAYFV